MILWPWTLQGVFLCLCPEDTEVKVTHSLTHSLSQLLTRSLLELSWRAKTRMSENTNMRINPNNWNKLGFKRRIYSSSKKNLNGHLWQQYIVSFHLHTHQPSEGSEDVNLILECFSKIDLNNHLWISPTHETQMSEFDVILIEIYWIFILFLKYWNIQARKSVKWRLGTIWSLVSKLPPLSPKIGPSVTNCPD